MHSSCSNWETKVLSLSHTYTRARTRARACTNAHTHARTHCIGCCPGSAAQGVWLDAVEAMEQRSNFSTQSFS